MRISRVVMAHGGMPIPLSSLVALKIPLMGQSVHAGFPSPADDFIESMIDLNEVLVQNPSATYMWCVVGDCMIDIKIFPGDVVIVDRSLSPKDLAALAEAEVRRRHLEPELIAELT